MPEMRQNVTVVPGDGLIAVDSVPLWFAFDTPANLHAIQWHDGAGEMEWTDDLNHPLTSEDYADDVAPFVTLWEAEKARLDEELSQPPTLEEAKAAKLGVIDAETSEAIMAGFEYSVDGTACRFSYDWFDQQNFADTANVCIMKLQGTPGLPDSVTWNAYTPDGGLVRLTFDAPGFLALYTDGAIKHKNGTMQRGGERKAAVEAATTLEEVEVA